MTNLVAARPLPAPPTPVAIASRPFLPGADHASMPATLSRPATDTFPLVLRPKSGTAQAHIPLETWAADVTFWMETVLHKVGALLVRGLPLATAEDLACFVTALGYDTMGYEHGTGIRHTVTTHVMTASDEPANYTIEPHQEMAFASAYPSKLLFFCAMAPSSGGETPIVDVRHYTQQIDPDVRETVNRTGIQYMRYLPSRSRMTYRSWQDSFGAEDPQVVERFCRLNQYDYDWDIDGNLSYRYGLPATVPHPQTGEELWFNQIPAHHASYFKAHPSFVDVDVADHHYPFHCRYGDGTEFSDEVVADLRQAAWRSAVAVTWEQGDLLILDNLLAQHGRMSFVGARKILVTLLQGLSRPTNLTLPTLNDCSLRSTKNLY